MNEPRFVVTDGVLQRLEPHLQGKASARGPRQRIIACSRKPFSGGFGPVHHGATHCLAMHVYMHEREPPAFGNWNSQLRCVRRWAKLGIFESFFNAVSGVPDLEYALIDGAIVQVRHTATGAKGRLNLRP